MFIEIDFISSNIFKASFKYLTLEKRICRIKKALPIGRAKSARQAPNDRNCQLKGKLTTQVFVVRVND